MSFKDKNTIKEEYFNWLYNYVCEGKSHDKMSYKKLFEYLHDIEFTYSIRNDENRAHDGIDLRYRFAMLCNDRNIVYILEGPCSILEMMVALAIRCEETIMDDTRYGNRTYQWFWSMMTSLGIGYMNDNRFDKAKANDAIMKFLNRNYSPNGKGGLFYIPNCTDDLRNVEIWTQMCWYLGNFIR